ncbi:MAG: hypothetical protein Q8L55_04390 [Phycisphaerales bacterium]|nr:hypothetical protein [Phycisphaerales bacterium]
MPESLLKDLFPKWQPGKKQRYRKPASESLRDIADSAGALWRRRWLRRAVVSALVVMVSAGSAFAYVQLRPRAVPDVFADDLADVLDYTLLTDEFNRLPVDERLALIKRLIDRLKSMDSNDSALVAGFAAGIGGKARAQLQKNSEKLMVDIWDKFAIQYSQVKPEDREAFLDQSFVDMTKMFEDVAGVSVPIKDEQRVDEARKQAKRDEERMKGASGRPVNPERAAGFMGFMNDRGQKLTNAEQRGRMAGFSRDMTRRLRGQDVRTGKPLEGGAANPPEAPGAPGAAQPPSSQPPGTPANPPAAPGSGR